MRVKILVGLVGPQYSLGPGDEYDFEDAEASRLIEGGYATPVIERAVSAAAPERRTKGKSE